MAKGVGEAGENPLVPNAKLRQMYTMMLAARALDEALAKKVAAKGKSRGRLVSTWGQEAVRVSTAIDLGADDLVSDAAASAAMALILGGEPASLLKMFSGADANKRRSVARAGDRVLPAVADADERLSLAVGAASALKTQGRRGVVVAYARKGELDKRSWQRVLQAAAKLELPIIFVVLPSASAQKGLDRIVACEAAREAGVPGMPVDACDAVALYRAVQESLGRTRSGDGPVLIESVSWQVEGKRTKREDPLEHLKESLLARKICAPAWFDQTRDAVRRRILAKKGASRKRRTTKRA